MALDVGTRSIGLALSDPLKLTAQPLTTLRRHSLSRDCQRVTELARRHAVERLIFGMPRHLDGSRSSTLDHIQPLAREVALHSGIRVEWFDERLSTKEAEEMMARLRLPLREMRRRRNEFAAALILQWYLEENRPG